MVQIIDYKTYQKENGDEFFTLVVQGEIEAIKSHETGRTYMTARTANVPCTFNEVTCKSLIGKQLPGQIKKVEVDAYDYTIPSTGETVEMTHRHEYISEEESIVENNVIHSEAVM